MYEGIWKCVTPTVKASATITTTAASTINYECYCYHDASAATLIYYSTGTTSAFTHTAVLTVHYHCYYC